jgi:hypothetical protein
MVSTWLSSSFSRGLDGIAQLEFVVRVPEAGHLLAVGVEGVRAAVLLMDLAADPDAEDDELLTGLAESLGEKVELPR